MTGKRGTAKLGFALMLRFYTERGRFPRGRCEIPDAAVEYVARQIAVERTDLNKRCPVRRCAGRSARAVA